MHEVITLACSSAAGHLATQLYNVQESHIPYSKDAKLTHSNDVFLEPLRANGKVNYYPRSIAVEYSGGYGFLGKHAYHEKPTDVESLGGVQVTKKLPAEKPEFQQRLDAGKPVSASMLDSENTRYWTNYNKLIYRPSSLLELPDYTDPDGSHRHFPRLTFDAPQIGEAQSKAVMNALDEPFRHQLEQLDSLQGVNLFTSTDSAWGAFAAESLEALKDEYFNGGAKHSFWCYGVVGSAQKDTLVRIRSMVQLAQQLSLFFPLLSPQALSLIPGFDPCPWHTAAVQSVFVNSLWGLQSQAENPVHMSTIEGNLLRGYEGRKFVNEICIKAKADSKPKQDAFGVVDDPRLMNELLGLSAPTKTVKSAEQNVQLGVNPALASPLTLALIKHADGTYKNIHIGEIFALPSFPSIFSTTEVETEFGQSTELRYILKDYRKIVQRVRNPQQIDILGDKAELIEDISALIEEYTVGYSDESE